MDEKNFVQKKAENSSDVLAFYDAYADTWDQRFGITDSTEEFHKIRLNSFLKIADLHKEMVVYELGAGTGPYVKNIAPLVKELICVDGSKEMLKVLQKNSVGLNNVVTKQIDLSKPADLGKEADLIFFFGLIEHVIDIDNLIENCKKSLKKNGKIVVISSNALSPWYYGIRYLFRAGKHCTTDKYYSRYSLNKVMQKHGFKEETHQYWGFFPAGINGTMYKLLSLIGKLIQNSPLKIFGGGMTISYIKQ